MFKLQTDQNVHFKINLIRYRTLNSYLRRCNIHRKILEINTIKRFVS